MASRLKEDLTERLKQEQCLLYVYVFVLQHHFAGECEDKKIGEIYH